MRSVPIRAVRVWLTAASILVPAMLHAQSGAGVVAGIVKDATGAPIAAASVTVTNEDTSVKLETTSNAEGFYRIGSLVPGVYRLDVTFEGFQPFVRRPILLEVAQTVALDVTLDVAGQQETIDVVAERRLLETGTATVSQTVSREMVASLPLPNRAASSLAALAPGVVMIDTGTGTAENYPVFSVAGGRARNQHFVLDGGNAANAVGLTRPQQLTSLPVDAMQEFRVVSNNYAAEYGHSTGGVVIMSTRSGTNQYRGSAFESLRHDALDARNVFAVDKAPIRLNQFGGTLGGPVRRQRTFFFGTWERTRQTTGQTIVTTVPTLLNRQGDFSDLRSAGGQPVTIYDPSTRQPFTGNRIPASRIDPVALAALQYYPLPNRDSTATGANNFVGNSAATLDRDIIVAKVDHQVRASDLLTARYYINDSHTATSGAFGNPPADPDSDITRARVQSLTAAHTHLVRSNLVNELRVTYLRRSFVDERPGLGGNFAGAIGLAGVSAQAFPAFAIPGYASLGSAAVSRFQTPILDRQLLESLSWSRGAHAYKFGVEFRAGANDEIRDRGSSGSFTFTPLITSNVGAANTGNALASFLLGEVNAASVQVSDLLQTRAAYWAFYAQDDWRLTDRLTLNYGLRWDIELPRRERSNRMNSFDPVALNPVSGTPGIVTFAGVDGVPERAFATDWNNFGPRIGLAYRIGDRTVARGGVGIFYGPTVSNTVGDAAALGFSTSASFVAAQAATESAFRLRDGVPAYTRPALGPGLGAVAPGERPNTAVSFFDPHQVAPTSYQSNASLQHELAAGWLVEIGYIGNVSRHLTGNDVTLNQVPTALMGPGDSQPRRPFPQFSNVTIVNPSIGRSSYHAGFVRVQKRFARGMSLLAHYTRSRFLDDLESANEYGTTGSYMDAYHRDRDWAASGSDVPHHLVLTALYEAPGGWRIGLLETLMSGAPFTVVTAANTTNAFPAGPLRPDLVRDPQLPSDERTPARWFDTSAFANPALFTFGNSPRSVLRGPGLATTDLTIEKRIAIGGSARVELRGEAYNLLNRANFNIPGYTLGAADFGAISSARPARTVQLATRVSF